MKVEYTRSTGKGLTYTIEADRHGSYWISLEGKVVRTVAMPQDMYGKSRFGSKRKELAAVAQAQADIEALHGFEE